VRVGPVHWRHTPFASSSATVATFSLGFKPPDIPSFIPCSLFSPLSSIRSTFALYYKLYWSEATVEPLKLCNYFISYLPVMEDQRAVSFKSDYGLCPFSQFVLLIWTLQSGFLLLCEVLPGTMYRSHQQAVTASWYIEPAVMRLRRRRLESPWNCLLTRLRFCGVLCLFRKMPQWSL
jgi:hypothetical protein